MLDNKLEKLLITVVYFYSNLRNFKNAVIQQNCYINKI